MSRARPVLILPELADLVYEWLEFSLEGVLEVLARSNDAHSMDSLVLVWQLWIVHGLAHEVKVLVGNAGLELARLSEQLVEQLEIGVL